MPSELEKKYQMKNEDAAQKICPFMSVGAIADFNEGKLIEITCQTTSCMAWVEYAETEPNSNENIQCLGGSGYCARLCKN